MKKRILESFCEELDRSKRALEIQLLSIREIQQLLEQWLSRALHKIVQSHLPSTHIRSAREHRVVAQLCERHHHTESHALQHCRWLRPHFCCFIVDSSILEIFVNSGVGLSRCVYPLRTITIGVGVQVTKYRQSANVNCYVEQCYHMGYARLVRIKYVKMVFLLRTCKS